MCNDFSNKLCVGCKQRATLFFHSVALVWISFSSPGWCHWSILWLSWSLSNIQKSCFGGIIKSHPLNYSNFSLWPGPEPVLSPSGGLSGLGDLWRGGRGQMVSSLSSRLSFPLFLLCSEVCFWLLYSWRRGSRRGQGTDVIWLWWSLWGRAPVVSWARLAHLCLVPLRPRIPCPQLPSPQQTASLGPLCPEGGTLRSRLFTVLRVPQRSLSVYLLPPLCSWGAGQPLAFRDVWGSRIPGVFTVCGWGWGEAPPASTSDTPSNEVLTLPSVPVDLQAASAWWAEGHWIQFGSCLASSAPIFCHPCLECGASDTLCFTALGLSWHWNEKENKCGFWHTEAGLALTAGLWYPPGGRQHQPQRAWTPP